MLDGQDITVCENLSSSDQTLRELDVIFNILHQCSALKYRLPTTTVIAAIVYLLDKQLQLLP